MRFNSRPYLVSAALLIAAAAHAEARGAGTGPRRVDLDSIPRAAETATPDTSAGRAHADGADAQEAPGRPASQTAPPAANAVEKGTMMDALGGADPDVQKIWNGP